jgi:hypothetical protein
VIIRCRVDEILILSPHGTKPKTSLVNHSRIGDWPVVGIDERKPGSLALLSVNKAKGLDSLAVIMIDVERFEKLATPQEQMNYFMGASRARQLLAILHKTPSRNFLEAQISGRSGRINLKTDALCN